MEKMEDKETAVMLATHDGMIKELYHRVKACEEQTRTINEISVNVRELAVNMRGMLSEQVSQRERISKLEKAPLSRYEKAVYSIFSAALGFLFSLLLNII